MQDEPQSDPRGISTQAVQAVVGAVLLALSIVVMVESRRLGAGWTDDGPGAGYFPFFIGLILAAASVGMIYEILPRKGHPTEVFADPQKLRRVFTILGPALLYVLAVQLAGLYVASAAYIALFMRLLGKYSWARSLLVALAVTGAFFCLFELWFKVPLFKGSLALSWT
ncbi:MAG TPA: tripartite tricarboxylate transporter TctB family protein [Burkholderiaceae bacterium]|nr:tripartite tricarboxylate transporter TctB family protein [Burkholderiaceae bacterium]